MPGVEHAQVPEKPKELGSEAIPILSQLTFDDRVGKAIQQARAITSG